MARGPNELLYDIGGGYAKEDWDTLYDYDRKHELHDEAVMDITEYDMIQMLSEKLNRESSYSWKPYDQQKIEKAIAIIRAYPEVYKPYPRNIVIGRHY